MRFIAKPCVSSGQVLLFSGSIFIGKLTYWSGFYDYNWVNEMTPVRQFFRSVQEWYGCFVCEPSVDLANILLSGILQ